MQRMKVIVNGLARKLGYQISRYRPADVVSDLGCSIGVDQDETDINNWTMVSSHTCVSASTVSSLRHAVEYIVKADCQGSLVECGVWKGGCSMVMAMTLKRLGVADREIYCYDTYDEGWPAGDGVDVTVDGRTAHDMWVQACRDGFSEENLYARYDNVKQFLYSSGYPRERIHLVKGKVEETIPNTIPDKIALLRLDTDWYSSTRHELEHLYPRLVHGGVLIIDDYGLWRGARKAVDEYFDEHNIVMLLNRIDSGGCRVGVKP